MRVSVFNGLEQVDWTSLHHAYGPAETTPLQLRALLSENPLVRKRALGGLWNTLIHQGTIYDATLHAVPFLLEVLAAPSFAEKAGVLGLLADCATGSFPDRYIVEAGCLLSELDTPPPEARRELEQRQAIVGQTQAAIRAGRAVYVRLLSSSDEDVAVHQAAFTLLTTPTVVQDHAWLATVLRQQVSAASTQGETNPGMRAVRVRFLGTYQPLDTATQELLTHCWQHDADPLVRLAAAVALATGLRSDAPPAVAEDVAAALVQPDGDVARRYYDAVFYEDANGSRRWAGMDFTLDLAMALHALGGRGLEVALPHLTRALAMRCAELAGLSERGDHALPAGYRHAADEPNVTDDAAEQARTVEVRRIYVRNGLKAPELQLAKGLLTLTFGKPQEDEDGPRHVVYSSGFSHEQQTALASLVACEVLWHIEAIWPRDSIDDLLGRRGLPSTREALRNYLAQAQAQQAQACREQT